MLLKNNNYQISISEEDSDFYHTYNWYIKDNGCGNKYLVRQDKHKKEYSFHREILSILDTNIHVDHINGNSLDNRRENLRICSNAENRRNSKINKRNTTGFKGVRKAKRKLDKPYQALIGFEGKQYVLGYFKTAEEAALAYDKKAKELHRDFAKLNFPKEE